MSEVVAESLSGLLRGLISGTIAFFLVMLLSIVYRYFTNEKLSSFIGIVFGLGFLGFSGGLLGNFRATHCGRRDRNRGSSNNDRLGS